MGDHFSEKHVVYPGVSKYKKTCIAKSNLAFLLSLSKTEYKHIIFK